MPRDTSSMSRQEVSDRYEDNAERLREERDVLDRTSTDVETIRDLRDRLELRGTSEGVDAVSEGVDRSEDATEKVFDREDEKMDHTQDENVEHSADLREKGDSTESDLSKINEVREGVETKEAMSDLVDASEGAAEDGDFLRRTEERTDKTREQSEEAQQEYRNIVKGRRR